MTKKYEQACIISNNIKDLRKKLGWTQTQLAFAARITEAALSKIEQDNERIPTLMVLIKIASALRVEIRDIIDEKIKQKSGSKIKEFYRKFGSIDDLLEKDQSMILGMVHRISFHYTNYHDLLAN